ncbi:diaminopimelate epimerase [Chloroflexota bacterium]
MNFTKVQGAGNDFTLIETNGLDRDWSRVAITMCDRHFGIGSDGLLLLVPSAVADFGMRIFNPDGSEAGTCGNGLRCLARYVVDTGLAGVEAKEISIEVLAGIKRIKLHYEGDEVDRQSHRGVTRLARIEVAMGEPKFEARDIPVAIEPGSGNSVDISPFLNYPLTVDRMKLLLSLISTGNPHAVYFWDHPVSTFPLSQIGPKVERHKIFPEGVNFEVVRVISRQEIEARVWEKGVGETLACGSGACAIAVAARLQGYIDSKVDIKLPGGILGVEWDGEGEVFLSGLAEIIFTGEWPNEPVKTG